ncbi:MAG: MBL fold metallo-hydrolase [Brevinema sp.]
MIICHSNGIFNQNTWIYKNTSTNEGFIIDPGDQLDILFQLVGDTKITHLVSTHGHPDHIQGLKQTKENYPNAIIVAHHLAHQTFSNPYYNLSDYMDIPVIAPDPEWTFEGNVSSIEMAGITWNLIHTPGHAIDHICIYNDEKKVSFVGDMIFEQKSMLSAKISSGDPMIPNDFQFTIGRTDFPYGCDQKIMYESILNLLKLHDDTIVHSGHGSIFRIKDAKECLFDYITQQINNS